MLFLLGLFYASIPVYVIPKINALASGDKLSSLPSSFNFLSWATNSGETGPPFLATAAKASLIFWGKESKDPFYKALFNLS